MLLVTFFRLYCNLILGHNWGSEHDPDTRECSPSSALGGKYIMYTYSVSGIDSNNKVSRQLVNCVDGCSQIIHIFI